MERMRFMVHQRRMTVEALKTKALLVAMLNPERAEKAAQDYFEAAMPVSEDARDQQLKSREQELEEIANMKPITMGQIKAGQTMGGTQQWGTSMHKR